MKCQRLINLPVKDCSNSSRQLVSDKSCSLISDCIDTSSLWWRRKINDLASCRWINQLVQWMVISCKAYLSSASRFRTRCWLSKRRKLRKQSLLHPLSFICKSSLSLALSLSLSHTHTHCRCRSLQLDNISKKKIATNGHLLEKPKEARSEHALSWTVLTAVSGAFTAIPRDRSGASIAYRARLNGRPKESVC